MHFSISIRSIVTLRPQIDNAVALLLKFQLDPVVTTQWWQKDEHKDLRWFAWYENLFVTILLELSPKRERLREKCVNWFKLRKQAVRGERNNYRLSHFFSADQLSPSLGSCLSSLVSLLFLLLVFWLPFLPWIPFLYMFQLFHNYCFYFTSSLKLCDTSTQNKFYSPWPLKIENPPTLNTKFSEKKVYY